MSSPRAIVLITRVAVLLLLATIAFLVFSPFPSLERFVGLTDLEAHALAMFALSCLAQLSAPWMRRRDIATLCLCFAGIIEVVQPYFSRDGNLLDFLAGGFGVFMSVAPMMVEEVRRRSREKGRRVKRSRFDVSASAPGSSQTVQSATPPPSV